MKREALLGVLKEHRSDYEYPNNYWEGVVLDALNEAIEIIENLEDIKRG